MPYPFAHPAAVLPLARPMGRFAAPSALVIGSIVPDFWYLVPFLTRQDTHSATALVWFCLPIGLAVYVLFHLVLKEPLIALVSPRLGAYSCHGLPSVRGYAVGASLLVGALTHLVWDGLTHSNAYALHGHNWMQHANTAIGTLVLAWWSWHKLRSAPARSSELSPAARATILSAMVLVAAVAACASAADTSSLRILVRSAAVPAVESFAMAIFVYCAAWHLRAKRATSA